MTFEQIKITLLTLRATAIEKHNIMGDDALKDIQDIVKLSVGLLIFWEDILSTSDYKALSAIIINVIKISKKIEY